MRGVVSVFDVVWKFSQPLSGMLGGGVVLSLCGHAL